MKKVLLVILFIPFLLSSVHPDNSNKTYKVTYDVFSVDKKGFSVTYSAPDGSIMMLDIEGHKWVKDMVAKKGDFLYISVQANHEDAFIYVNILINGVPFKAASSEGDFVIASCSGSI